MDRTAIRTGDYVRSFDFPPRTDCFFDGVVLGNRVHEGCERYVIKVTRQVAGGADVPFMEGQEVLPPINGTPTTSGSPTFGVRLLGHPVETTPEAFGKQVESGHVEGHGFATIEEMRKGTEWYPGLPLAQAIKLVRQEITPEGRW